jgi:hypothetical protein
MFRWRHACAASFLMIFAGIFLELPIIFILSALAMTLASAILTIYYIGRLAQSQVGTGYAVRHVLLTIMLMPIVFLGIWVVPELIKSDLINSRSSGGNQRP